MDELLIKSFIKLPAEVNWACIYNPNHKGWRVVLHNVILSKQALNEFKKVAELKQPEITRPEGGGGALETAYNIAVAPTYLMGGPNPFSLALVGSIYGIVLGKILGKVLKFVYPSITDYIALNRLPIIGGILGAVPGLWVGGVRLFRTKDITELFKQFPKEAQFINENQFLSVTGAALPRVDETHWRDLILGDPFLNEKEKVLTIAPLLSAGVSTGSNLVTPWEVAKITAQAGLGAIYGLALTSLASRILGMSPKGRAEAQKLGVIAGILKGLIKGL